MNKKKSPYSIFIDVRRFSLNLYLKALSAFGTFYSMLSFFHRVHTDCTTVGTFTKSVGFTVLDPITEKLQLGCNGVFY